MIDEGIEYQQSPSNGDQDDQESSKKVFEGSLDYPTNTSSDPILFRLDEVDEICRICLNPGTIPIFGNDGSNDISVLKNIAGIDMSLDDGFPLSLCTQCQELLESAITFRKLAQTSDAILRKKVDRESPESNNKFDDQDNEVFKLISEDSEDGVYLECETLNESDNENAASDIDMNAINDSSSIQDCIDLEPEELKSLVENLKKNAHSLRCEVCDMAFRTEEQLGEHKSSHDPQKIVICELCKNIIHVYLYSMHLKLHKESYKERLNKKYKKIECTVCEKYVSKYHMKKHMIKHGTEEEKAMRFMKCTVCDKRVSVDYFKTHMKIVHNNMCKEPHDKPIKKIKCPICSHMFKETTYKKHVESHAKIRKKYFCEECGKEFCSKSSFATHTLTHKDEYKYECQFCPYRGKHLGLLKVHVRIHTKDYPYKCTTCDASFTTKSNLSAHEKTHSTAVKFICSECGKCFTTERYLKLHIINVHDRIKAFACEMCGKKYARKQVLQAHKKRVHKEIIPASGIGKTPSYLLTANENNTGDDVSQRFEIEGV